MPQIDPSTPSNLPLFPPESSWTPPKEPPNLGGVKRIGLDTETKDPRLTTMGPGFLRRDAEVVGISVAAENAAWYFPIAHPEDNCEWNVLAYLKDLLCNPDLEIYGANLPYELEGLDYHGVPVRGKLFDVQIAEPLLDEEREGGYSLDVLARDYLSDKKDETVLRAAAAAYGIDPKGEMYKLPARFVGEYAEHDAILPLRIFDLQRPKLEEQDLWDLFLMETELLPIVYAMRKRGVRIDLEGTERLGREWKIREDDLMSQIKEGLGGLFVDIWSGKQLEQLCRKWDISYPLTDKGNPSFGNEWLEAHENPVFNLMGQARGISKMRRDFINGSLLKYQVDGRLHANFHTLRGDENGTRSGRFSSSDPNLQQIPARNPEFGPAIRALFLPEEGEEWYSGDFKSQEPRLLVHFAGLLKAQGAEELVAAYNANPLLDLHMVVAEMCSIAKRQAKTVNLGMTYGMGEPKLAHELGLPMDEAMVIFEEYHRRFPFVRIAANTAKRIAEKRGYVRTVLGRRRRFKIIGGRRQFTHKALNSSIQGSGADMIKKAISAVYKEMGRIPMLTVHDENNYSIEHRDVAPKLTEIMEKALPLLVPNKIDTGIGENWSEAH